MKYTTAEFPLPLILGPRRSPRAAFEVAQKSATLAAFCRQRLDRLLLPRLRTQNESLQCRCALAVPCHFCGMYNLSHENWMKHLFDNH